MTDNLELVQFMTAEIGDDLIVSFFVAKSHDPPDGRSIILMRDKKWEHLVAEWERGYVRLAAAIPRQRNRLFSNDFLLNIYLGTYDEDLVTAMREFLSFWRHFFHILHYVRGVALALILVLFFCSILMSYVDAIPLVDALYLTLITGMTIDYGDITPTTTLGRVLSVITGVIGGPATHLLASIRPVRVSIRSLTDSPSQSALT